MGLKSKTVVLGTDGHGESLTPQQIKTALKISQNAEEQENEFEELAKELGFDTEAMA